MKLLSPKNNEKIDLHTEIQKEWLENKRLPKSGAAPKDWLNLQKEGTDRSFAANVDFSWEDENNGEYVFEISEYEDFEDSDIYICRDKHMELANFYIGRKYFWRVKTAAECSEVYSFETLPSAPRFLSVGGVSNVRDIGGWNLKGGGKIRQGLVIRGGEMEIHQNITEQGLDTMNNVLKIKTDLDLRAPDNVSESALGKGKLLVIESKAYDEFLNDEETARAVFEVFEREENYPIYVHCWGGADRTGTVIFILEAVLGMKCEDMFCDYELTSLGIWGERSIESDLFKAFMKKLKTFGEESDSVNVLCENFLKKIGITDSGIEKMRKILIEKNA